MTTQVVSVALEVKSRQTRFGAFSVLTDRLVVRTGLMCETPQMEAMHIRRAMCLSLTRIPSSQFGIGVRCAAGIVGSLTDRVDPACKHDIVSGPFEAGSMSPVNHQLAEGRRLGGTGSGYVTFLSNTRDNRST